MTHFESKRVKTIDSSTWLCHLKTHLLSLARSQRSRVENVDLREVELTALLFTSTTKRHRKHPARSILDREEHVHLSMPLKRTVTLL